MNYIDIVISLVFTIRRFPWILERIDYRGRHFSRADIGGFHCHTLQPFYRRDMKDFLNITSRYLSYIALAVTFLLVVIAVYLLGKMLTRLVDIISLGLVNKLLGTLLGIAKYFIMVCVLLMIVDALNDKFHFISEETRENSLLFDPFLNFAQQMYNTIRF